MKIREIIIGNRIFLEVITDDEEELADSSDHAGKSIEVEIVPDYYGEL